MQSSLSPKSTCFGHLLVQKEQVAPELLFMLLLFGSVMNNACQNIIQWFLITLLVIFSDTLHLLHLNIEIDKGKNHPLLDL